uniref:Uncharacterized protein n=1 Tax=Opuntia streptacantha TaxID=393608 RepID=A0A7C8ZEQ9_OPUST
MAALNFTSASASKPLFGNNYNCPKPNFIPKSKELCKLNCPPSFYLLRAAVAVAARSEGTQGRISEEEKQDYSDSSESESGLFPSARAQLDLLEQLTSSSASSSTAAAAAGSNSCLFSTCQIKVMRAILVHLGKER